MIKKFSMLALAGLIALPIAASAGVGPQANDLDRKIQDLSSQLDQLKAQMAAQAEANAATNAKIGDMKDFSDRAEDWDLAARFKLDGDFRSRLDFYNATTVAGNDLDNDTAFTNRFRLNMRVGVTENVEFKGRVAMYKAWGDDAMGDLTGGMNPPFDGNSTRTPGDDALRVDRAFLNFNNIGGAPVWFSIGRRPTTDGNPSNIRMNLSERSGTPLIMDYAFDGISTGYAYNMGEDLGTGRVRICYGRGFEDGLYNNDEFGNNRIGYDDTDFAGVSWDILKKGDRFLYAQSFIASSIPGFTRSGTIYDNIGNLNHTSAMYMDKFAGLNYFVAGGWSHSDPTDHNFIMGSNDKEDGYHAHVGVRYDIENTGLKVGAEYNYGSEYWIGLTPGHDDLYQSKIAARGNVYEVYGIYDLPMGEAISKYAKTFMRLGYQRYDYKYAGSNDWMQPPTDLDSPFANPNAVETADQVYLTLEATF